MILVDANVLLDVVTDDPRWAEWSQGQLDAASLTDRPAINAVIQSELSVVFARIEEPDSVVAEARLTLEELPREALFLAGKAFLDYRRRSGTRQSVLPDFDIGAHAAVMQWPILTRDLGWYRGYFPTVHLIAPGS